MSDIQMFSNDQQKASLLSMLLVASYHSLPSMGFYCVSKQLWITLQPKNMEVRAAWDSIERAVSTSVRFMRSALPFCFGVFGTVHSWTTPSYFRYDWNLEEINSPPLSVRRAFNFTPLSFSTIVFHSTNFSNASSFRFRKYTHVKCVSQDILCTTQWLFIHFPT